MQRFSDSFVSRGFQFSVGIDNNTKKYFISFLRPTINRQSDYEDYYFIPENLIANAKNNPIKLNFYVDECRNGLHENEKIRTQD